MRLSKLIYSTCVLGIPEHLARRINRLHFNFIWEGKTAKIKIRTIIAERKHGGLKMMDFEIMDKALKIAWIKRLNEQSDASWKIIPEQAVNLYGGLSFLTNCHFDINLLDLQNIPPFYHVVLKYWQEFELLTTACDEKTPENDIIWNNFNILVDQKSIFYNAWFKKGIVQVKDLIGKRKS